MTVFVALLAFILWLLIAFFVLRLFFRSYFHEPRRAEIAALVAAVAFAVGTVWPFSVRVSRAAFSDVPSRSVATPVPTAPLVVKTPSVAPVQPPRDVSALCRSAKDPAGPAKPTADSNPNGSVDPVASTEHFDTNVTDGGQMNRNEHYRIQGWAIAPEGNHVVPGVCLLIDGRIDRRSRVLYGFQRPDISAAFRRLDVAASGFEIAVPAGALPSGAHRLQVATITERGELRALPQGRNVTIY